ncbi:eukaryotic translation initiation factor 3 subunit A-like [Chenopodium quinoa]|uniref:eukaryotic translation initiation factor 3 subunit A-like n=1 Tax=Chenopodium quinoa TaxID=63459 RepID=UPI000B779A2D|nr:eukaryotic translation initiation factor 3 subunit A-like [Chenopodium quinoa]
MSTFAKPENALKRAEELINVGQKQDALQALHDLITSKRYRAWQKTLEKIMFKYIDLCVEMRKGRYAKDGLIQYRIVCQQVNVNSLEEVIKHFMHLSTEKAELARNQAQEALEEALDVEDLEADKRPEDLMLSYVSGEKGKDRSDRELVTPWFKFLWETYRTVLEILRNNSKLENLYAMTAHRAFQFCKQYKRTTEFRRLCEIIRNHLSNLNKYKDQRDRPDLTAPESLQLYLDTRFEQLKIATELELWQEAFRSVEDIHGLMCMVKKTPKPSLMVVYYAKLTEIFWISGSHLYHAYAWLKLFLLQKNFNKNLSQKDLQTIASSVVLAALSVPPYDHKRGASHLELENEKERNMRMSNLINFNLDSKPESREVLSRSALLLELVSKGVMSCVLPEVKDLYHLLEHEFLPLDLSLKVQPLLNKISKLGGKLASASSVPEVQLSKYSLALEKLATLRLLQQASQVYQTMTIESLSQMIPFFDFSAVEKISVDAVKHRFINMKVDHMNGAVSFNILDLESDTLRNHLTVLAESLNKARSMIYPPLNRASKIGDSLPGLAEVVEKEHKKLLARKTIIEQRKEEQERQLLEKEREEELKRLQQQKNNEEAEQKRLAIELEKRKIQRIQKEIEEREKEETKALIQEKFSKNKKKPLIEGDNLTKQQLMELALNEQLKEKQEMEKKLQKLSKQMDYFERAKREEAAPLIESAYQQRLVEEQLLHEREQQLEVELSRQRHDGDLQEKNRLARVMENKKIFQERVVSHRQSEFERLRQEREEHFHQIREARKQERVAQRKMLFYLRSEEEKLNRLREEEDARKREEAERRRKEDAEHQAKLDEIAEKQRQRERELEEKERLRRQKILAGEAARSSEASPLARPQAEAVPASAAASSAAPAAAAAAPAPTRYVPRHLRENAAVPAPAPTADRWRSTDRRGSGGGSSRPTW